MLVLDALLVFSMSNHNPRGILGKTLGLYSTVCYEFKSLLEQWLTQIFNLIKCILATILNHSLMGSFIWTLEK